MPEKMMSAAQENQMSSLKSEAEAAGLDWGAVMAMVLQFIQMLLAIKPKPPVPTIDKG